ncbi:MAG TPA: hypothetical protein VK203_18685, partial [Nostocaceae cyanobacterium]|nr:hypothetical protein [Nostocaceae cyanobacterium]
GERGEVIIFFFLCVTASPCPRFSYLRVTASPCPRVSYLRVTVSPCPHVSAPCPFQDSQYSHAFTFTTI